MSSRLREKYARETDPARHKAIAEAAQVRATQYPTHIPLGQWFQPAAMRKNVVAPAKGAQARPPLADVWIDT